MKVTSKGQVTIPQELREKSGIVPGSEVEFVEEKGRLFLRKIQGKGRGTALVQRMQGRATTRMSTDDILALTRGIRGRK